MDTKEILLKLRTKSGFSQDELAEKLFVTRQAVSRWENGDTVPNTETLKLLQSFIMCQSIPCSVLRENSFVNVAVCRWKMRLSAERKTAL